VSTWGAGAARGVGGWRRRGAGGGRGGGRGVPAGAGTANGAPPKNGGCPRRCAGYRAPQGPWMGHPVTAGAGAGAWAGGATARSGAECDGAVCRPAALRAPTCTRSRLAPARLRRTPQAAAHVCALGMAHPAAEGGRAQPAVGRARRQRVERRGVAAGVAGGQRAGSADAPRQRRPCSAARRPSCRPQRRGGAPSSPWWAAPLCVARGMQGCVRKGGRAVCGVGDAERAHAKCAPRLHRCCRRAARATPPAAPSDHALCTHRVRDAAPAAAPLRGGACPPAPPLTLCRPARPCPPPPHTSAGACTEASAPEMISVSSVVILACRARL
jgi:hypothetical protein